MIKSNINLKDYRYCLLALYVPVYILLFFIVEHVTPTTGYWVSYCGLDDLIPFCEYFVVAYYMWYPYIFFIGLYLMITDKNNFKRYMYTIIIGFTFSLVFCLLFPNGQDLRPVNLPGDNLFLDMVRAIYAADTNTNVLPSIHVYGAIVGMVGALTTEKIRSKWTKGALVSLGIIIAMSTCFIKQHSILDGIASIALYAAVYAVVYIFISKRINLTDSCKN